MARPRRAADADIARGEREARVVLARLGIAHAAEAEIEDIAWRIGPLVRYVRLHGAQGRLVRMGRGAIISVNSEIDYRPRQRFTIAHELGHYIMHGSEENQLGLWRDERIDDVKGVAGGPDAATEREANAFASEFLMPSAVWSKLTDVKVPSLEVVKRLQDQFQVSFVAAGIRFAKLCPERCATVFCQDGKTGWVARGDDFGHWIPLDQELDRYTLASEYFTKGSVDDRQQRVSASAWLTESRLDDDAELFEHCRPIPKIRATLSLLWIPSEASF